MQEQWAFVDVDSTLWDFGDELRKRMIEDYGIDVPDEFTDWRQPEELMESPEQAYKLFNDIHYEQDCYKPFKSADRVLKDLRRLGYKIMIASNRIPETREQLIAWLDGNELIYDDVFCGLKKHELFDTMNIGIVVDDAPHIMEEAVKRDIDAITLQYKYNHEVRDVTKFRNLQEMHEYLIQRLIMSI